MNIQVGNMWDVASKLKENDLFCITTNAQVRKDGGLVMGRGIARQAAQRYSGLQTVCGDLVKGALYSQESEFYGLIIVPPHSVDHQPFSIGLFQVKYHWMNLAELSIIERSAEKLAEVASQLSGEIHLNFPGVGNGGLTEQVVRPVLERHLSSTKVNVWRFK